MTIDVASLRQMWANAWPVISVLLLCSVFSGAIILERWVTLRRAFFDREALMKRLRRYIQEKRREQIIAQLDTVHKPVGRVLSALMDAVVQNRVKDRESADRFVDRLIRVEIGDMTRYVTGLGTIGSVAPFIGLFGTVIGIIHAFKAIAENAGGGPGVVANGIAEALVTTALGLFVAIPAVVAYNMFTRKIEQISDDMQICADELVDSSVYEPPAAAAPRV
jgi:biopolymer transport protein ExbB/TolQ